MYFRKRYFDKGRLFGIYHGGGLHLHPPLYKV